MPINDYMEQQINFTQFYEQGPKIKYVATFYVQIPNDAFFKVGYKIIGHQGENNKKIIEKCTLGKINHDLKLRFRGKGSGFKEGRGRNRKESMEPL